MDSVLIEAGSCGRFQVLLVFLSQLPRFVSLWAMIFMMFGGYNPGWRCNTSMTSESFTNISNKDFSSFNSSTKENNASLTMDSLSFSSGILQELNSTPVLNINSSRSESKSFQETCDSIDSCTGVEFNPSSTTIVTKFQLICGRAWIVRALLLALGIGCLFGPLLSGQIGERFGRKIILFGSMAVICFCSCVAVASTHWAMFAVCYFFIGAFGNSIYATAPVFAMEFLSTKWRGYFGSLPVGNLALMSFVLVTAWLKNWVHVYIVMIILEVFACAGFFLIPESARWLIMSGQHKKAEKSLLSIAKINGRASNMSPQVFINLRELTEKETKIGNAYTLLDIFKNKKLFINTLKVAIIFFIFECSYMTVTFGTRSLPGNYYSNAIESTIAEVLLTLLVGPLCNRMGRRLSGLFFSVLGVLSSLSIVLILSLNETGDDQSIIALKIFAYIARASSQCISLLIVLFAAELFPTVVRNVSAGFFRCCSGLGSIVAPFLTPDTDVTSLTVCFGILCVFYIVSAVLFPSFHETRQSPLVDRFNVNHLNKGHKDMTDNDDSHSNEILSETPNDENADDNNVDNHDEISESRTSINQNRIS